MIMLFGACMYWRPHFTCSKSCWYFCTWYNISLSSKFCIFGGREILAPCSATSTPLCGPFRFPSTPKHVRLTMTLVCCLVFHIIVVFIKSLLEGFEVQSRVCFHFFLKLSRLSLLRAVAGTIQLQPACCSGCWSPFNTFPLCTFYWGSIYFIIIYGPIDFPEKFLLKNKYWC